MWCMKNKSNTKWLFTCRILEVKMTTSHATDTCDTCLSLIWRQTGDFQVMSVLLVDHCCNPDMCPAYSATPRYQDLEHLQRLGKPGKYSVFLQVLVYPTCEGLGLLCPSSLQSISSQVQLVWSSAATNSKQPAHI